MTEIVVFYHAYLANQWRSVFQTHLQAILESGLYDAMREMHVGVVWHDESQLDLVKKLVQPHPKIHIRYPRRFDSDIPFGVNRMITRGDQEFFAQIGESETILKIPGYARSVTKRTNILFLHTKGVSSQCFVRQKQDFQNGKSSRTPEQKSDSALDHVVRNLIQKWEENCRELETRDFTGPNPNHPPRFGSAMNMWWTHSEFIARFDLQKFLRWQHNYMRTVLSPDEPKKADWRITRREIWDDQGVSLGYVYAPNERHAFAWFVYQLQQCLAAEEGSNIN